MARTVGAVDGGLDLEADALIPPRVLVRGGRDAAGQGDRLGDALDGDVTVERDVVAGDLSGGGEGDLGVGRDIEEVRGLQMAVAVTVAGVHGADIDAARHRHSVITHVD